MIKDISHAAPEEAFRGKRIKEKTYAFDLAFDETVGQDYIFSKTTKFLIDGIMSGFNATVFAYGATGAGKTYTMMGEEDEPGIMLLSVQEMFDQVDQLSASRDYKVKISYIEVYNEIIKDLLKVKSKALDLREDNIRGITIAGVTEIMTTDSEEIMRVLREGNKQRSKESTAANEVSSRSHAVLQITVEFKEKSHGTSSDVNVAKLSLIDLAGSERAAATQNTGIRLIEGANINRSLLALGNCINALCSRAEKGGKAKGHIPYRDSKLTRLLKDSLGGNCRTVMITNISPSYMCYEDTLNTLKYADRAKQIKTVVKRNVLNVEHHISNYRSIINNLRSEIDQLRSALDVQQTSPQVNPKDKFSLPPSSHSQHVNRTPQANEFGTKKKPKDKLGSDNVKEKKIEMNILFEKEAILKKKILKVDKENDDLAFTLFAREIELGKAQKNMKHGHKDVDSATLASTKAIIKDLTQKMSGNTSKRETCENKLTAVEERREELLENFHEELDEEESGEIDLLYN